MRLVALVVLVLLATAYSWMALSIDQANERTRVYLAVALVDDRALSIDGPVARFGPALDWARRGDRYYTDKAPGLSLLAAAAYGAARLQSPPEDFTLAALIGLSRAAVMLPMALLGFLALGAVLRRLGVDPPLADACALAWSLGTTAFHYNYALYGHQVVAVALLGALLAGLRAVSAREARGAAWGAAGAGACLGLAGITEYQSAGPCAIGATALAVALVRRGRPRAVGALALAGLPFLGGLLLYHDRAFGGPFELPYHHLVAAEVQARHVRGIGGVGLPSWEALTGLTVSLHRGLLATSPISLLALPGLLAMWRAGRGEPGGALAAGLSLPLAAVLLIYLAFASGSDAWYAGWSFGPRLLLPALGLAMVPVAWLLQRAREAPERAASVVATGLALGLAWAGVLHNQLVTAFFAEPPEFARNPVIDVVATQLPYDLVAPNLVSTFSAWQGLASLRPLAVLVAVVLAVLARLLLQPWPAGSRRRRGALALALVPPAAVAMAIILAGGSFSPEERSQWIALVSAWYHTDAAGAGGGP